MEQSPRARLDFPRTARIKQGRDFRRVKINGQRLVRGCLILNWASNPTLPRNRLGVVTSRKIGGAVERNRARRLIREAFRLHQHKIAGPVDLVCIARASIREKAFAAVETDFLRSLEQAGLMLKSSQ